MLIVLWMDGLASGLSNLVAELNISLPHTESKSCMYMYSTCMALTLFCDRLLCCLHFTKACVIVTRLVWYSHTLLVKRLRLFSLVR